MKKPKYANQNKIIVHLNDDTHAAIKKWAKYQGTTMPKLAQSLLEDMNPLLEQLIETYEEIMSGKDKEKALNNFMAKGLTLVAQRLQKDDNAEK